MANIRSSAPSSPTGLTVSSAILSPVNSRSRMHSGAEPFPGFHSDSAASTASSALPLPQSSLLAARNDRSIRDPGSSPSGQQREKTRQHQSSIPARSESDHTDALWAEMQATLADVELSASQRTHFFGPAHSAALDDLRNAQVELAKAWARGGPGDRSHEADSDGDSGKSPGTSAKSPDDGTSGPDRDLEAARKQREANDRYFYRIQHGVLDVVDKLESVAQAMSKVERESREIWTSSDSDDLKQSP